MIRLRVKIPAYHDGVQIGDTLGSAFLKYLTAGCRSALRKLPDSSESI
jgi:hypothetical protein